MEDNRFKDGKSIKQTLDDYLKSMGVDGKLKESDTLSNWPNLLGDAVAKRTKNIYIKDRVLYVELNSSVVRDELQQSKSAIIEKLNKFAGFELIINIYFK